MKGYWDPGAILCEPGLPLVIVRLPHGLESVLANKIGRLFLLVEHLVLLIVLRTNLLLVIVFVVFSWLRSNRG